MTEWCSNNLWEHVVVRMRVHEAKGSTNEAKGSTKEAKTFLRCQIPCRPLRLKKSLTTVANSSTTGAATTSSSLSWLDEISLASSGGIGTRGAGPVRVSDVIYQKR